jgi:RNA polymerase sigma-70 factor (ECF subfamily)
MEQASVTEPGPVGPGGKGVDLAMVETRLRRAFVARFGVEVGVEATAEAMAWAWEHRGELAAMDNPAGYLFRVGQSRSRRLLRWRREPVSFPPEPADASSGSGGAGSPWAEPGLDRALAALPADERTAVVLVHCFQWTYAEVGDLLGVALHTVRNHVHRGLTKLRTELGAKR